MIALVAAVIAGLVPLAPAVFYFVRHSGQAPTRATRRLLLGLQGFNLVLGLMIVGIGLVWLATPHAALAAGTAQAAASTDQYASLAAAISTGLATVGAGIAVSSTGAAAVGAIAEKPETLGRSLIFVGLAEGIAIYGLIIAFMVLNR